MSLSPGRGSGTRGRSAWRRRPGSRGVLSWLVTGRPPCRRRAWIDRWPGVAVVSSLGGSGGLEHAVGYPVEGFGVAEVGLAGRAGLVGAVGAHLDAVGL